MRLCFVKTTPLDGFLAKMALQSIHRLAGDEMEQLHLHPIDADRQGHLCRKRHPPQLVTVLELYVPKSSICPPVMHSYIHFFSVLNCLLLMHLPGIASTIQILIQVC